MRRKIIDKFTNLPVSKQRKWQLRNPKQSREITKRYEESEKGIETRRNYYRNKAHLARGKK